MMEKMICIVCPIGCHLQVNTENYNVIGNKCNRGAAYGKAELTNPTRVITSTVKILGALDRRCPVKTSAAIPKNMNFECMEELKKIELKSPVKRGDIVIKNIFGTGSDVVVTKDM